MPWFLWMFVALVIVNSLGLISQPAQNPTNQMSRGCLVVAIAALGLKTSLTQLAQAGWRSELLILVETLRLAILVLACVLLMR